MLVAFAAISCAAETREVSRKPEPREASRNPDARQEPRKPNIILILTDDQDPKSLEYMPHVQEQLVAQGTTFRNFTLTLPKCCPSRATFLRGQYAHNHKVGFGEGTYEYFATSGRQRSTVATWLDGEGYRTGLFGKYLNGYRDTRSVPPGWDSWYTNADKDVWSRCFNADGRERCPSGHLDTVLGQKAEAFLADRPDDPFFLYFSPNAPHQRDNGPPPSDEQDRGEFGHVPLPRAESFNEAEVSDKPGWVRSQKKLNGKAIREMTMEYRARLRSLQAVDRAVDRIVALLELSGEMDDTYIFYTTDNGYHMGQHRLPAGKMTPYTEDLRFPLIVRGPGVPEGQTREEFVQNTDFAPTVAELAGAPAPGFVDGTSMLPLLSGDPTPPWRDVAYFEGGREHPFAGITTEDGEHYIEWEGGFKELYDLNADPHQLENLAGQLPNKEATLHARLSALEDCERETCRSAENGTTP
jgi:N-acetylglucosamine-6-sulfatase